MIYRHLLEELQKLSPDQLEQEVMVYHSWSAEYIPVWEVGVCADKDPCDMSEDVDDGLTYDHIVLVTGS